MAIPLETVLRLDDSEYNRKMDLAGQKANIFATKFNRSLINSVTRIASIGVITATFDRIIEKREEITGLNEEDVFQLGQIEEGFKGAKEAADSFFAKILIGLKNLPNLPQMLIPLLPSSARERAEQRARLGMSQAKLNEAQNLRGPKEAPMTPAEIKEIEALKTRLARLNRDVLIAGMTKEELSAALKHEIELADREFERATSEKEKLMARIRSGELQQELTQLSKQKEPALDLPAFRRPNLTALSEIGGNLGPVDNLKILKAQSDAVFYLKRIEQNTVALRNSPDIHF